jgi:hypothetical protein
MVEMHACRRAANDRAPEQQAEIVKPGDNALQLYPIHQKDRQWRFGFTNVT